jgi:myo-inositol-1(or 4)-monophosphatase
MDMVYEHRLQPLLRNVVDTAVATLAADANKRAHGEREGQYALDLLVDGPLVQSLLDAGLGVLSEEAGEIDLDRALVAVVDPVDGSTNASRSIPWYNTSICVVDDEGPLLSIIENHVTRERFEAVRGVGATRNGSPIATPTTVEIQDAVVAVNGVPPADAPWAQFRSLGASALDLSYVAVGAFDAYVDFAEEAHGVWDYLGALLICREMGVHLVDAFDRELVHLDHADRRTPIAAHDVESLRLLAELRRRS